MSLSAITLSQIILLRRTSGAKAKRKILESNKHSILFRKVLHYTYNPYIKFHIRKIPKDVVGRGFGELNHETWVLLNKLSLRKLTGIAARETLFEYIDGLSPSAATLLKMIIRKDLKAGIATKTINSVIPNLIPTFECQLVEEWDDSKANWPMLVAPKIDGTRGEKREGNLYTRSGRKITGVQHIVDYMNTVHKNMATSGELWIPGMPFRRSSGIIRSNKPEKLNVRYAVFDMPLLIGDTLEDRLRHLSKAFYPLGTNPLPPVCHIPHVLVNNVEELDRMYNYWRSKGYEGLVAKDPKSMVFLGRNYSWMRRVSTMSVEKKIVGVYESEEKPGFMGGIVIEGGIKVGSGFVDAERKEYLKHPERIIGKMATIEAKEETSAGSLRQPIFKAIRWDI